MAFPITCSACGATYRIPDALFASRFAGRETTIKCKRCSASVVVDGTRTPAELDTVLAETAELITESVRPASVAPAANGATTSSRPAPARRSVTPRPWVGFKSVAIAPAGQKSQPPSELPSVPRESPEAVTPSVPVIPIEEDATPAVAPRLSLLHLDLGPSPSMVPAAGEPPPESVPRSRPPPLPPSVAAPARPAQSASPPPPRARPAAGATPSIPGRARAARWIALALGASAATWWVAGRDRGARDAAPAAVVVEHRETAISAAPIEPAPAAEATPPQTSATAALVEAAPSAAPVPAATNTPEQRAAELAVTQALSHATKCQQGAPAPSAFAVDVAFAPTGQVVSAEVEAEPPVSEAYKACLLSHVRVLLVPPFQGSEVRVRRAVSPP